MTGARLHALGTAILIGALFVGAPDDAAAFNPTKTCDDAGQFRCRDGETPRQVRWATRCVKYIINQEGSADFQSGPDGKISDELKNAVIESFQTWNEVEGSDYMAVFDGLTSTSEAVYDKDAGREGNVNVIVWRDESWPYASESAYAITSVTFAPSTGIIADVDMELNGEFHTFTNSDRPGETRVDIKNTITHESGHFLGLDHTSVHDATMFGSAPPGELQKRTLHQDDIDGLIHIYPTIDPDRTCDSPEDFIPKNTGDGGNGNGDDNGCCATTPAAADDSAAAVWLTLAFCCIFAVRRRQK